MRLSLALLCLAIPGLPQPLTIGVEGGVRLSRDPQIYDPIIDRSNSKPYLVGPMIEVRLPFHFAFETDALYSRLGNTSYIPLIANESYIRTIANSWEFPLLVKYRSPVPRVHPYVSVGVAPRRSGGRISTIHYGFYPSDVTFSSFDWHAHGQAFVWGGGVGVSRWRRRGQEIPGDHTDAGEGGGAIDVPARCEAGAAAGGREEPGGGTGGLAGPRCV